MRYRTLGWCLGIAAVILLIAAVRSPVWIVTDDGTYDLHIGLWAEERCGGDTCHEVEQDSAREAVPKAGVLGVPTAMLGLLTGVLLVVQLWGVRTRAAMYLGAGGVVIATILVFRRDAWVPGPGYTSYLIACLAAMIAAALLPDPLPRSIPPRPADPPPDGSSAMQPPPEA